MSFLDAMRQEASLIADLKTNEVMAIVERNRVRGRIWLLRRRKALPINELEDRYIRTLNRYVYFKIKHNRQPFSQFKYDAAAHRDEMTRIEEQMCGETPCEKGFLFSGHFAQ